MSAPYDLWYWPSIQGRGEFVRLYLAALGVAWRDRARTGDAQDLMEDMEAREQSDDFAPYAPPYLVVREGDDAGFAIAQVAHILAFLTDRHDRGTGDLKTDLHLIQLQLTITDIVAEVHNVHHPVSGGLYYDDQKDAAKRAAEGFRQERVTKYFDHFETALGKRNGPYMLGEAWSHVDTSLFQLVEGLRYAFPQRMAAIESDYPRIVACRDAVAKIEGVTRYLDSEERIAFNEDGIFRHYPELDAA
ncbi:glutathione S-transferase [Erythrobacter sp. LQ02-29]|uniref:glutathione S-transferase n=1 Tax=Erythrobacter sp. LQ02-29 TaxID=2920384 RepID=UPI001F4EE351|nr:glutathione S-transferase [Erythrobacter sp. LQ02-29]MCP9223786.1 glutathione S-transferase [Erythrobacter sp. LQ02-29]